MVPYLNICSGRCCLEAKGYEFGEAKVVVTMAYVRSLTTGTHHIKEEYEIKHTPNTCHA